MDKKDIIFNVIISEKATDMLVSHTNFLAQVSIRGAENLKKEIISTINSLQRMPERYGFIEDDLLPKNKYRKALICKRYLLIYQIKENTVYIDYVLDCRQNYEWLK